MNSIRWAVIGVGRFGKVHCRALQSLPYVELAAVCTRNPEHLRQATAEFDVPSAQTDWSAILDDDSIQAVSITTHWRDHFEVARAALERGKHVLLEKPMAASSAECRRLQAIAEGSPGVFMVGHICRFDPRCSLAHEAIRDGRIGRVVSIHAKRNLPKVAGHIRLDKISPLMGDGIHDADLIMWFMQQAPHRVYARHVRAFNFKYPDVGWAVLDFDDGRDQAIGVIETNWGLPENAPTVIDARLEVVGTAGKLTINCAETGLSVLDQDGLHYQDTNYWPQQYGQIVGVLRNEIEYFADCIRHQRQPRVVTTADAVRAVEVMELAEQSAVQGGPLEYRAE